MLSYLLAALAIAALVQPNTARFFAALVFVGGTLSHDFLLQDLIGLSYYGSAALTDLGVIVVLSLLRPVSKLAVELQRLSFISIIINAFGWVLWVSYEPPAAYDAAFLAYYAFALLVLIKKDKTDVGRSAMDRRGPWFLGYNWARARRNSKNVGEL